MTDWTDDIKKRLEAATPGPWAAFAGDIVKISDGRMVGISEYNPLENRIFIANAPTDIKNLLEEREVLREALKFYATGPQFTVGGEDLFGVTGAIARQALAWVPQDSEGVPKK